MLTPPPVDLSALRRYRLGRIRNALRAANLPLAILVQPVSLRYAVDYREFALFQAHVPVSVLFVPLEGPVVLYGAYHRDCPGVDEFRPGPGFNPFDGGLDFSPAAEKFADEVVDFLAAMGASGKGVPLAVECLPPEVFGALKSRRLRLHSGEAIVEQARSIKCAEEITCLRHAVAVAELGITRMHDALRPGVTENTLWSLLQQVNVAHDGDWSEGRMLASGPRTNPWLQEASGRAVQAGELVAFDTDLVGPFGYCADISRTWLCGDAAPTAAQRDLYRHAWEEVEHNTAMLRPGMEFREAAGRIYPRRPEFVSRRYPCFAHGVGMSVEYPKLLYPEDGANQYDGVIEPGMVLCVESYTGAEGGGEGVKLEQMLHVTNTGCERLSTWPYEDALLPG